MRYQANPVIVDAFKIVAFDKKEKDFPEDNSNSTVTLEDGQVITLDDAMMSRFVPGVGDYYVIQADGYPYLNPKEVFEKKYAPIEA